MILMVYLLALAEALSFVILLLPFGILAFAQIARENEAARRKAYIDALDTGKGIIRWHIVGASLVAGTVLLGVAGVALGNDLVERSAVVISPLQTVLSFALGEALLWLSWVLFIFCVLYVGRLHRRRVQSAGLIALGAFMLPIAFQIAAEPGAVIGSQTIRLIGVAAGALFLIGLLVPNRLVKVTLLSSSCLLILFGQSGVSDSIHLHWILLALGTGYAVFRIEWRNVLATRHAASHDSIPTASDTSSPSATGPTRFSDRTVRVVTFLATNTACVALLWAIWRIGFAGDDSHHAAIFAVVGIGVAVVGFAFTMFAPVAIGKPRSGVDLAAATLVTLLVAASSLHLIGSPAVYSSTYGTTPFVQLWKPILGAFAVIGAIAIAITTLAGKERQIRPFMLALVIPAVVLLPADEFFKVASNDSLFAWTERVVTTGIAASMLWIMWYAFGPGLRRLGAQQNGPVEDAEVGKVAWS